MRFGVVRFCGDCRAVGEADLKLAVAGTDTVNQTAKGCAHLAAILDEDAKLQGRRAAVESKNRRC
jgi:hypothetical protein